MGAVWVCARRELRRHWPGHLALTLLVALVGGTVLAVTAGAHRTNTAFDRFLAFSRPAHAIAVDVGGAPDRHRLVASLPQVDEFAVMRDYAVVTPDPEAFLPFVASVDGAFGRDLQRTLVIEGRSADPSAADEVALSERQAELLRTSVGETLSLPTYRPDQIEGLYTSETEVAPEGPVVRLRVVGIVRGARDVGSDDPGLVVLTPAFNRVYGSIVGNYVGYLFAASLRGGEADVEVFTAGVRQIYGDQGSPRFQPLNTSDAAAQSTVDVLAVSLLLFAAAAALAGLVALGVAMSRQIAVGADDDAVRRDLGMNPGARFGVLVLPRAAIGLIGAAGAVLLAVALSPRFPIGLARTAEPDPGLAVDLPVLLLGAALLAAAVVALAAAASWRTVVGARFSDLGDTGTARRQRPTALAAAAGLPPTAVLGVRLATEAGGGAAPVRPGLLGATLGVAGLVATLVFGAGLDRLVQSPQRWGWSWDIAIGPVNAEVRSLVDEMAGDIDAAAVGTFEMPVAIAGDAVATMAFEPISGSMHTTLISGRSPQAPDEVVLGADTLDRLGLAVGDTTQLAGPEGPEMRIVGQGVFASIDDLVALADGAELTPAGVDRLDLGSNEVGFEQLVVRWAAGVDPVDANRRLAAAAGEGSGRTPTRKGPPGEIDSLAQVDRLPGLLAAFLAVLGILAVVHAASSLPPRRRREMGILATIGFTPRQRGGVVAWQTTAMAAIALIVGVPAGLVAGRLTWAITAAGKGVATDASIPVSDLLLAALGVLVVLAAVGLLAGRGTTRVQPARALRAE